MTVSRLRGVLPQVKVSWCAVVSGVTLARFRGGAVSKCRRSTHVDVRKLDVHNFDVIYHCLRTRVLRVRVLGVGVLGVGVLGA